jgi:hypothetical protein
MAAPKREKSPLSNHLEVWVPELRCNEPAESPHFEPPMQMLEKVFLLPAAGAGSSGYRNQFGRQWFDWHASKYQTDSGVRIVR